MPNCPIEVLTYICRTNPGYKLAVKTFLMENHPGYYRETPLGINKIMHEWNSRGEGDLFVRCNNFADLFRTILVENVDIWNALPEVSRMEMHAWS